MDADKVKVTIETEVKGGESVDKVDKSVENIKQNSKEIPKHWSDVAKSWDIGKEAISETAKKNKEVADLVNKLKIDIQNVNIEYKKGAIPLEEIKNKYNEIYKSLYQVSGQEEKAEQIKIKMLAVEKEILATSKQQQAQQKILSSEEISKASSKLKDIKKDLTALNGEYKRGELSLENAKQKYGEIYVQLTKIKNQEVLIQQVKNKIYEIDKQTVLTQQKAGTMNRQQDISALVTQADNLAKKYRLGQVSLAEIKSEYKNILQSLVSLNAEESKRLKIETQLKNIIDQEAKQFALSKDITTALIAKFGGADTALGKMVMTAGKFIPALGLAYVLNQMSQVITKTADLASQMQELQNISTQVFGQSKKDIDMWAQSFADAVGRTQYDIAFYTSKAGAILKSSGIEGKTLQEMSQTISSLAVDFASFYNLKDDGEAFRKVLSGITGGNSPFRVISVERCNANTEITY